MNTIHVRDIDSSCTPSTHPHSNIHFYHCPGTCFPMSGLLPPLLCPSLGPAGA